ncbi:hypothetical protein C1645_879637 [Glomus cerebriforme]|uniref:Uncharacterized protein n=1 Tax=Glomus cerebriforme TaxID=658196 RepID=A0A397SFX5_9GLOM|nr:hypothetical protein C1645_879637 [Glomus cerebriforme]
MNNEDLSEKFSKDVFRKKHNKNMINPDGMCSYGVDCRKKLRRNKKEIELEKRKRNFKKESRIFMHKYRNREILKNILKSTT